MQIRAPVRGWIAGLVAVAAAACTQNTVKDLVPGRSTAAEVQAVLGPPLESQSLPQGETLLWFAQQRPDVAYGAASYAARIGADGKLVSLEQRLTDENIGRLAPGRSRVGDVRELFGPPYRAYHSALKQREVWEYPLARGTRPGTLFVEFTADDVVSDVFVLEQRAPRDSRRPSRSN